LQFAIINLQLSFVLVFFSARDDEANLGVGSAERFERAVDDVLILKGDVTADRFAWDPNRNAVPGIAGVGSRRKPPAEVLVRDLGTDHVENGFPNRHVTRTAARLLFLPLFLVVSLRLARRKVIDVEHLRLIWRVDVIERERAAGAFEWDWTSGPLGLFLFCFLIAPLRLRIRTEIAIAL